VCTMAPSLTVRGVPFCWSLRRCSKLCPFLSCPWQLPEASRLTLASGAAGPPLCPPLQEPGPSPCLAAHRFYSPVCPHPVFRVDFGTSRQQASLPC
jgi:hypothetical protein